MASKFIIPSKHPNLQYEETVTMGHYAPQGPQRLRTTELSRKQRKISPKSISYTDTTSSSFDSGQCYNKTRFIGRKTQDWLFLTLLGIIVAFQSFFIDVFCDIALIAHRWLYARASVSIFLQYIVWVGFPLLFILFAVGFTHLVGPTATGSGVPEIKTILNGVILKQYLTLRNWIAKFVALSFALASGMPLGKLGPFVHMGSLTASSLSKLFPIFRKEFRKKEFYIHILTAGAATGVSCIFSAPIGGVLFSIEATATYYAMKNYWRGFYAAMCGALTFRFLTSWSRGEETLTAFFRSNLRQETSYDIVEIIILLIFGAVCGLFGALFVFMHKNTVLFIRRHKLISSFLQKNRFIYPTIVTVTIYTFLFPAGLGQFYAGQLTLREAVNQMFDNRTWSTDSAENLEEQQLLKTWKGPLDNVLLTIFLFFVMRFWMCTTATTMPVPCGIFIPAFSLGSAFGRLTGECLAVLFPLGIRGKMILPGAFSIVGAACVSGAMTHTVSPAVIAFELTGYLGHILPCVLAVAMAGAVANFLEPSAYDAMIMVKKLPFLPPVIRAKTCNAYEVKASDIMVRDVPVIYLTDTLAHILHLVLSSKLDSLPVLDDPDHRMFVGLADLKKLRDMILESEQDEVNREVGRLDKEWDMGREELGGEEMNQHPPVADLDEEGIFAEAIKRRSSRFSVMRVDDASSDPAQIYSQPSGRFVGLPLPGRQQESEGKKWYEKKIINLDYAKYVNMCFNISSKLTLYKIHWIFSYLSLHKICITENGKFVGIITLTEVLKAISNDNRPNMMSDIDKEVINLMSKIN